MTLQLNLEKAEQAYLDLISGSSVVSVVKDGREVRYAKANATELKQYIQELKFIINNNGQPKRRGPLGVRF